MSTQIKEAPSKERRNQEQNTTYVVREPTAREAIARKAIESALMQVGLHANESRDLFEAAVDIAVENLREDGLFDDTPLPPSPLGAVRILESGVDIESTHYIHQSYFRPDGAYHAVRSKLEAEMVVAVIEDSLIGEVSSTDECGTTYDSHWLQVKAGSDRYVVYYLPSQYPLGNPQPKEEAS